MKQINIEETVHRGENRIKLMYKYNTVINSAIRKLDGRRWSKTMNCWHLPYRDDYISYIYNSIENIQLYNSNNDIISNTVSINTEKAKEEIIYVRHNRAQHLLYINVPYKYKYIVTKLTRARWHEESKLWLAIASEENLDQLQDDFKNVDCIVKITESSFTLFAIREDKYAMLEDLTKEHILELNKFKDWMTQKRLSKNTIKVYYACVSVFFRYFAKKAIDEITSWDIEDFNNNFIIRNGYSSKTQNQYLSSIKSYYIKIRGIKYELNEVERPIEGRKLPRVIAIDDVKLILSKISNIKHLIALSTIYSLGLRRSELLNLKLEDISFNRDVVKIINSKGRKDRDLPLPRKLKELMAKYITQKDPKVWFIEGQKVGEQYSTTSVSNIFHKYTNMVISVNSFTLHSLRHSYATHLLDMGVDLRNIQELLGHKSSRTTEIYTHVSMRNLKNIKNPLDDFDI